MQQNIALNCNVVTQVYALDAILYFKWRSRSTINYPKAQNIAIY